MSVNRSQLAKILEMLGSAHDGEALSAARRAHALIKAEGESWESLLVPATRPSAAPAAGAPAHPTKRGRLLTTYDMYQALQKSARVPQEIKKQLRASERALIDGELTETEIADIKRLFEQLLAAGMAR